LSKKPEGRTPVVQKVRTRTVRTEFDEEGRSWVVIDADIDELQVQEYIGGIPDVWKRR
jgi:hypothetical protein